MTSGTTTLDTAVDVLAQTRADRAAADATQARLLRHACAWADLHPAESLTHAATYGDTPVTLAGPGAPLVAEFAIAEYAAALGLPTETGKAYLGEASSCGTACPACGPGSRPGTSPPGADAGSPARPSR